ncbi:hypothetical protein PUG46_15690 [Erwiniaceae bacterium L1_55_4]|nr:hypothetical protein [Erwiniaceae bacterium L1_55_4]
MLWSKIFDQAETLAAHNAHLSKTLHSLVTNFASFQSALAHILGHHLASQAPGADLTGWFSDVMQDHPRIASSTEADLVKLVSVNPAAPDELTAFLGFRGIQALAIHRIAHQIWRAGDVQSAVLLQNWASQQWNIDIHPAAKMGSGLFVDHGIGLVIGETAVVEDEVSLWHGVTLGSTLTEAGDRHPKIGRGALICAGATVLGNITVGTGAIVAANSVVTKPVPDRVIVAGCPARIIGNVPNELDTLSSKNRHNQETL